MRFRYNSPLVQIILVSVICFCCPGMFNALNGMGGGGQVDTSIASKSSVALYVTFAVVGLLAGGINNLLGARITMMVGALTYALYSASFLAYGLGVGGWIVVLAGGLLGAGAGLLWTSQGSIMMAYPEESKRGLCISVFWAIFNMGAVIGNIIPLALNLNNSTGTVSNGTYIAFIAIMVLGSLLPLLLVPIGRVVRDDGSTVVVAKPADASARGLAHELASIFKLFGNATMLLMIPMFWSSNYFYTYQFSGYNAALFTTATRSFNGIFYWGAQMLGAWAMGALLDGEARFGTRRRRALLGLGVLCVFFTATWAGGLGAQLDYHRGSLDESTKHDFRNINNRPDSAKYAGLLILYICYGLGDAFQQTYCYWLMGALSSDASVLSRYAGFYKSIQSAGAAVAWAVDSAGTDYLPQLISSWSLFTISMPFVYVVVVKYLHDAPQPAPSADASAADSTDDIHLEGKLDA